MRLVLALAAFAAASSPALAAGYPVTVKSCDRDVTFDAAPQRAVSNDVNLTEMMLALGLTDRMVGYTGVSGWKTLDETLRQGLPNCRSYRRNIRARKCCLAPMRTSILPAGTMACASVARSRRRR